MIERGVDRSQEGEKKSAPPLPREGGIGSEEFEDGMDALTGLGGRRTIRKRRTRRKVRKKGTKKKARRRRIYKSKASKRFIDTFNIKKTKKNRKYPFTRGNLFYLNKKSHGKRITSKIIRKYPKAFNLKLRKRFLK